MPATTPADTAPAQTTKALMERVRFWGAVQGVSGLIFGVFLTIHLVNSTLAAFGPEVFDAYIRRARLVYQHPVLEPIFLGSVIAHLVAWGAKPQVGDITKARASEPLWRQVHRYTGYVQTAFVFFHVFATRLSLPPPLSFHGIAATMHHLPLIFVTYYVVYGACGAIHLLLGLPKAIELSRPILGRLGVSMLRPFARVLSNTWLVAASVVALVAGTLAMTGLYFPVVLEANEPYRQHFAAKFEVITTALGIWHPLPGK